MNVLFTSQMVGNIKIKNRFIHSATYEGMADPDGKVTRNLIKRYHQLAQGDVGLIIPGFMKRKMSCHQKGKLITQKWSKQSRVEHGKAK
jgi:2,4-dienoyl-CoA reductase-like NADH-dependent reductase (Old Yellow Enzyme family)